uniref:Exportin-7/Ran-binding protein 17 TPR repeats domain-containing protein n=1 Tax=Guillardia theta TaxID=55529 RepID=A0A7S4P578_GUITH|mmetsp:Transcript_43270/g.136781  ORF Transcript_43270/g.136781 Transcript_43270/m.136781 type:complete len:1236 (+) Transcript_43270:1006-4713(+)
MALNTRGSYRSHMLLLLLGLVSGPSIRSSQAIEMELDAMRAMRTASRVSPCWRPEGGRRLEGCHLSGPPTLRLKGGMDQNKLMEFESILEQLQHPEATAQQRQHAQQFALMLQNPVDLSEIDEGLLSQKAGDASGKRQLAVQKRMAQLQHILDHSRSATAQVIACNSLTALITNNWDNITIPHVEIRNYALTFLFAQVGSPSVPMYVVRAMMRLLSRVTKLGWLQCDVHRNILADLNRFYDASVEHYIMGLQIKYDLVEEMDVPAQTRKEYVLKRHFLASGLLNIFKISLDTLQKLQTQMIPDSRRASGLMDAALQLAIRCLSYDFMGQSNEETESFFLPVPMQWKAEIKDPSLVDLLFKVYYESRPPQSSRALELLMLFISVPRFSLDAPAAGSRVFNGIKDIFRGAAGLVERENHQTVCKLLGAYRDLDVVGRSKKVVEYTEWLSLAANFTIASLKSVETPTNSLHYLMLFWWRLATQGRSQGSGTNLLARIVAMHQANNDDSESQEKNTQGIIEKFIPEVVNAYILGRLDSVEAAANGRIDDPLDDVDMLQSQLELLPVIASNQYAAIGGWLTEVLDRTSKMYEAAISSGAAGPSHMLEKQLSWLVRVCAAMIGGHYTLDTQIKIEGGRVLPTAVMGTNMQEGDEMVDADLIWRMLQLMMLIERRNSALNLGRCDYRLEIAMLSFMDKLKQGILYVDAALEQNKESDEDSGSRYSMPHFLQSLLGKRMQVNLPKEVYKEIFQRIGLGDHKDVLSILVRKVITNLKVWADNPLVVKETLLMFATMVQGPAGGNAARMLLDLEVTKSLLVNHNGEHVAFLSYPVNAKQRTTYYLTLMQLLVTNPEDPDASGAFEAFLHPLLSTMAYLNSMSSLRTEEAKFAIIGLARDLRGIACASNVRLFPILFESLYPSYLPLFTRALDVWHDDPAVTVAVLKFWMEMAENKEERIRFDAAFPGGLLLFKEMSRSITTYAHHLLNQGPLPEGVDAYKARYKALGVCMASVSLAISGEYVSFGAYTLYGDQIAEEVVSVLVQLALSIPERELLAFHKVATSFYSFIEALLRHAMSMVIALETNTVVKLLQFLHHGLANALQQNVHILCARSIDRFAAFLFRNKHRQTSLANRMRLHMEQVPTLLEDLQLVLLKQIITDEHIELGILSHPLLSLILASESGFTRVSSKFVSNQPAEERASVAEAFGELMQGVERNLEMSNRRTFLMNVQSYRRIMKSAAGLNLD